jgi:hypothetical protein
MIALTGHTGQVGTIICNHFTTVKGFSRSNGYDIRKDQNKILNECADCDVFINCAHGGPGFAQTELFWLFYNEWIDQEKTIINIGTAPAEYAMWSKIRRGYCSEKSALAAAVEEAQNITHTCKVSIINPYILTREATGDFLQAIDFCIKSSKEIKSVNL